MHTPTNFDQTDRASPLVYYNNTDEYLSDSSSYSDNGSDLGSDDYNNYEPNYKFDNEKASCALTSITETPLVQLSNKEQNANASYSLRQEEFNNSSFSSKDLLNAIWDILLSPPRDISNDKGSLDCLSIYSFLFLNEKGSTLYNAYDRNEVKDKIHECINGQKPLRAVINIDTTQEDMRTDGVKPGSVFI
ncbi:hypothetical protein C1646_772704 [Rhizophagus diaphanus]|nr:hypothetical protein C1646_772704 [Rhizophagus diaphanus] [Rhizophagus sp. MUCL 43196]